MLLVSMLWPVLSPICADCAADQVRPELTVLTEMLMTTAGLAKADTNTATLAPTPTTNHRDQRQPAATSEPITAEQFKSNIERMVPITPLSEITCILQAKLDLTLEQTGIFRLQGLREIKITSNGPLVHIIKRGGYIIKWLKIKIYLWYSCLVVSMYSFRLLGKYST